MRNPFRCFNSSPEIIRLTVMMYIRYPKIVMHQLSGRKLPPLGQGSGAVLLEDFAAFEVTFLVEMLVDWGVNGGEFLQGLHVPELRHRSKP